MLCCFSRKTLYARMFVLCQRCVEAIGQYPKYFNKVHTNALFKMFCVLIISFDYIEYILVLPLQKLGLCNGSLFV